MQLINTNILITGATSGVGAQLVEQLYQQNTIYVIARDQIRIEELLARYPKITCYRADLSDIQQIQNVAREILSRHCELDVLINNAAVQHPAKFTDEGFNPDAIHQEITTNLSAVCYLSYALLPLLTKQTKSIILNINSGLGLIPKTSSAVYCATKGALNIFSQSLEMQLEKTNISVLQAFLPLVDTAMTKGRGKSKLTSQQAATYIIKGIKNQTRQNNIGKIKLLRVLIRILPSVAKHIMRKY
jgi:short-subunit dehydrogenase involved in D-alanine esterification of teichoic acids